MATPPRRAPAASLFPDLPVPPPPPSALGGAASADPRVAALGDDDQAVLLAFALGWAPRTRTWVTGLLAELRARGLPGQRLTGEAVQVAIRHLSQAGWLDDVPHRLGYWQVPIDRRAAVYLAALDQHGLPRLRAALTGAMRFDDSRPQAWLQFTDLDSAAALVRLELFGGTPLAQVERLRAHCRYGITWDDVLRAALVQDLDEPLLARLEPGVQAQMLRRMLLQLIDDWTLPTLPAPDLAFRHLQAQPGDHVLRLGLVVHALWGRDPAAALPLAAPWLPGGEGASLAAAGPAGGLDAKATPSPTSSPNPSPNPTSTPTPTPTPTPHIDLPPVQPFAQALTAAVAALQGRWVEAEQGFERALQALRQVGGKRRGLLPELLALPYVLTLLAQGSPAHLERALKFCLNESGKRQGSADSGWGLVALAIQVRRGDARLDLASFRPLSDAQHVYRIDLWRWLMRAWLKTGHEPVTLHPREQDAAAALQQHLTAMQCPGLVRQLDGALAVLRGAAPPAGFFVAAAQEGWRIALAELATLGELEAAAADTAGAATRLLWVLDVDPQGVPVGLQPQEQKRGPRGWGKPRDLPLSRLTKTESLAPQDAAVALALRTLPYQQRGHRFDLAAAVTALVGHPALELADAPGVPVQLSEGQAELDVTEAGDTVTLRLVPPLRGGPAAGEVLSAWPTSATEQKEQEALRLVTVLRDGPQRARLVRLTTAQKRAAQLIGDQLVVPKTALPEVQAVLQRLGSHFQVHADGVQAPTQARDVPAESRLRAELSPQGDALSLRLVVAPLGPAGPRLNPGQGRSRLLATVDGETLGAQRDLALERSHLDGVLDACPMLAPPADQAPAEWRIDAPDEALALLERLPTLNALAGVDWPKGKPVTVDSAGLGQLKVSLRTGREWLALDGGVQVDETRVMGLTQLLDWTRHSGSRFVPLGEGRYLALTQELRGRLDELARVAHAPAGKAGAGEVQLPTLAAAWLDDTLQGSLLDTDAGFRQALQRLEDAQALQPAVPGGLQADLRPYQRDGFAWALRLAEAGFGAVLADDMGLGKTLQALAVLLARAGGGPALVVAPTSLGGNWRDEARRFAPALQVQAFGDGDRGTQIDTAGPGEVLVVSYQLLLQHAGAFARRRWHTLVLDEAQAIKNATAKRSQAAFDLQADFRLALSGTPIENRLSELWSIMRVCNPGLLGSLKQFNERFAGPIERDQGRTAQRTLRKLIGPFILRRTKAQVLDDLPPRTELTLSVEADATERAHYEALRREALAAAEEAIGSDKPGQAQFNILAQLTRLRRAACDPRLVSPQLGLVGAKVQAFGELAAELVANGHKALVFSQFVDFLALLREPLDAAGIAYQYLDGSTPAAERTKRVAAFQAGQGDLFLISLKAGGFGLNLTVADYVVIADPWWNPAAEDQASGRAHRIGQRRPVTVYRLVNQGTLEDKIVALHQHKRELADSVLDGADPGASLQADELVALMRGDTAPMVD